MPVDIDVLNRLIASIMNLFEASGAHDDIGDDIYAFSLYRYLISKYA